MLLSITEFAATTNAAPIGVGVGPDGNLYYTEQTAATNAIGVMDSSGNRLADFTVPTGNSRPEFITQGWDGNMWFTEQGRQGLVNGKIASITTDGSGTITEYPVTSPDSFPTFITAGPDGNMWFTEEGTNRIAMIDLAGGTYTISEVPIPASNSLPLGITAGPDGNVWFTQIGTNQVGYIDIAGGTFGIHEIAIPTPSSQPVGITAGPDGNIWFTESNTNKIGSIDLVGGTMAVTEYPVTGTGLFIQDIIGCDLMRGCTPDGNVWFTETGDGLGHGSELDNIDLAGGTFAITQMSTPTTNSAPVALTVGPALNDIWFVEVVGNKVAEANSPPGPGGSPIRGGSDQPGDLALAALSVANSDFVISGMDATPLSSDSAVLATSITDVHYENTARPGSDAVTGQNAVSSPMVSSADSIAPVAETSVDSVMALDLDPI